MAPMSRPMSFFSRLFKGSPSSEPAPAPQPERHPFGFVGLPGEESLGSMTPDALLDWENRGVPTIDRLTDAVETVADERQDLNTSLNFPLHWTSPRESWDYLFDFAVACDLLSPRPDDRILDLAAGTCWASELLVRIGVRTVSVDLSPEMMRRGRLRLTCDSRLVFRNEASFLAARGQALPFVDESFDGVLCLNALHHHPDYRIVLREIYRVLKSGARAVFSEPGTAHGGSPLSQFRMKEESILEKPVSLPFVKRIANDVGFTRMLVVPLRSAASYAIDYHAADQDVTALEEMWSDTLRHSPREHARFALYKGDEPPADTLLPAQRLVGRLLADISLERATPRVRQSESFADRLRVRNAGTVTWKARGRRFGGQVTCGLKVYAPNGDLLREDLGRTPIPHDVHPGEECVIEIKVPGALETGTYQLKYDMVVEGVTWFESQGSPCPQRVLEVTPEAP